MNVKKNKDYDVEDYVPYNELDNSQDKNEVKEEISESQLDDNEFYEEIKKIKSKGKRFK